jgi:hypothetical protein
VPEDLELKIKEKIKKSVQANEPIHLTVPFGGYKKWQLPTYPGIDWAEVFNVVFLREFAAPLAAGYNNGLVLEYFSDEIFVARMNNYPQQDLDVYNGEFSQLIAWFGEYVPENMQLTSSKIRDDITSEELHKRFDKNIQELREKWDEVPKEQQQIRLKKSERNYKGDLSKLSPEEKQKVLWESTLVHDAFIFGDWDHDTPWAFDEKMIALGFRYTGSWGIHIRSSRSSTVQFWIGMGALQQKGVEYIPTILTYQQYLAKRDLLGEQTVELFDQSFSNLSKIYSFTA